MLPFAMASMYLAAKPNVPDKYFVIARGEGDPANLRILSTSGFVSCAVTLEGHQSLQEREWVFSSNVQLVDGEAVAVRGLWEPPLQGDVSIAFPLQYTFDTIEQVHVGHVYGSVALLRNIMDSCNSDWQNMLYQSTEWKSFILNCWLEQISAGIQDRHCLFWQKALERCSRRIHNMIPDLLSLGRASIAKVVEKEYLSNFTTADSFAENKRVYSAENSERYACIDPFSTSVGFLQSKKQFYTAVMGYNPPDSLMPKNIEMARALSQGLPPPFTPSRELWKFFGIAPPKFLGPLVTINYCTPLYEGREFGVVSPAYLNESLTDVSAGEILSKDLWITALTFDLDGKTVDACMHSQKIYQPNLVLQDLTSATREVMLEELKGRWDIYKHKPAIHAWQAESKEKLSMRISLHLPENVAFVSLEAFQAFVRKLTSHIKQTKYRYMTVLFVILDKCVRFEMSIAGGNYWFGREGEKIIRLEEYIQNGTKAGGKVHMQCHHISYTIWKSFSCSYTVQQEGATSIVFDLTSWIACTVKKYAFVETFIDEGIYCHNHSIRLPGQSKLSCGSPVRKFVPCTPDSKPVDALMHFPHNDTPPIPTSPILITDHSEKKERKVFDSVHTNEDMTVIREFIRTKYSLTLSKTTPSGGLVYLDVSDGHSYCLVKGGTHSHARMFLVYDKQTRDLLAKCWSSRCKEKLQLDGNCRGLFLCNVAQLGELRIL